MQRLKSIVFDSRSITIYNDLSDEYLNPDHTSRLSPWLSNGCLSIRHLHHEAKRLPTLNEDEKIQKSMFLDTLYMKDFYKFWCIHNGKRIYREYGISNRSCDNWKDVEQKDYAWRNDKITIARWKEARTGMPIIDSIMKELNTTGWITSMARKIVANYFSMS